MTNVVGILVIILIVTQVNVTEATRRIRAGLPDVSEEQLVEQEKKLVALRETLEELKRDKTPVTPEKLVKLKKLLAEMKKQLERQKLAKLEMEEQKKLFVKFEEGLKKLEEELEDKNKQLAVLTEKIKDAETVENEEMPVRLPNPRPAEEGFTEVSIAVTGQRLYDVTLSTLLEKAVAELQTRDDLVVFETPRYYDRPKLLSELNKFGASHPDVNFKFTARRDGQILVQISAKPDGGEPIEAFDNPDSPIRKSMASAKLNKNYVRFFVTEDSFDTYIDVRQRAESFRIPAGWYFAEPKVLRQFVLSQVSSPAIRTAPDPDYTPPEKKPPVSGAKKPVDTLD